MVKESKSFLGDDARIFRLHHEHPSGTLQSSYVARVAGASTATLFAFAMTSAAALSGHLDPVLGSAALAYLVTLMNGAQTHMYSHIRDPKGYVGKVIKYFRDKKDLVSWEDHMEHRA